MRDPIRAAMARDPAARGVSGVLEIVLTYSGVHAVAVHRASHCLRRIGIPFLPRLLSQVTKFFTGVEIHPGAEIGRGFFIDHGTGVVVGETTEIGNRVRLYQGVTLGALSIASDAVERFRDKKRHPTIEDDVIIYSNATLLGAKAVIGARSIIGGNVWITGSVPPDTKVLLKRPELVYIGNNKSRGKARLTRQK